MHGPAEGLTINAIRDGETMYFDIKRRSYSDTVILKAGERVLPTEGVVGLPVGTQVTAYSVQRKPVLYRSSVPGLRDLSPDAWHEQDIRLRAKGDFTDGYPRFAHLEDEVAYERHRRAYSAETQDFHISQGPVTFVLFDKVPEVPFVTPMRFMGGEWNSRLCVYDRKGYLVDLIRKGMEDFALPDASGERKAPAYNLYHHSHEVSLHMPGGFHRKTGAYECKDTWEVIKGMMAADAGLIRGWLQDWNRQHNKPLDAVPVLAALQEVIPALQRVIPRNEAGRNQLGGAITRLRRLQADVERTAALNAQAAQDEEPGATAPGFA